jgi:ABC-type sugar transport system ATPase subunit
MIDPRTPVSRLSTAQMQMVEIAKVVSKNTKIIIMDEPTSSLSKNEVQNLFDIITKLKSEQVSIIFISHKLDELFTIADRVTVLRDGEYVGTRVIKETDSEELVNMMIGRKLDQMYTLSSMEPGRLLLSVQGLSTRGVLEDISFELYQNEILGLAGLVGAGRTELMKSIFGANPIDAGQIFVFGQPVKINSPEQAIRAG